MRRVEFEPAQLVDEERDWWERWSARAADATQAVLDNVAAGNKPGWNPAVWSELKQWLLAHIFDGKCAYCEKKITGGFFGDAEHYRPKGKVTVKERGQVQTVMHDGKPHPGYYWLAYDWRNLVPACELCNSSDGKMNQFPVANSYVFRPEDGPDPDALDLAEGLLLCTRTGTSHPATCASASRAPSRRATAAGKAKGPLRSMTCRGRRSRPSALPRRGMPRTGCSWRWLGAHPSTRRWRATPGDRQSFAGVRDYLIDKRDELVAKLNTAFGGPDRLSSPAGVSPPTQ
jgi:hypothetical protein